MYISQLTRSDMTMRRLRNQNSGYCVAPDRHPRHALDKTTRRAIGSCAQPYPRLSNAVDEPLGAVML
jgi:hypothetical protein